MPEAKTRNLFLAAACTILLGGCNPLHVLNALTPESGFKQSVDIAYAQDSRQKLDVYSPLAATANAPVVVFFYGGTWSSGNKHEYLYIAAALAKRGFVTVIPDYRLYPVVKFPAFIEDAAAAVAWTQNNISIYGGDPQNIILLGHSAGAHIAAMLTLDERYLQDAQTTPVRGMIGLAGPYDFLPLRRDDLKDMFGPPERYTQSQPINFVDGTEPPLLLLHGRHDGLVYPRNTENLAAKIETQGGCVRTVIYPQLDHFSLLLGLSPGLLKPDILRQIEGFVKNPDCKN